MPLAAADNEEEEPDRNDLAALNGDDPDVQRADNGIDILDLDHDEELPAIKTSQWKNAKNYDWQATEAEVQRKAKECRDSAGKSKMLILMQYAHFDTALVQKVGEKRVAVVMDCEDTDDSIMEAEDALDAAIEDAALRSVLREDGRRVGFVFSKISA